MKDAQQLRNDFFKLCEEIEKLPASEQQTRVSILASDLESDFCTFLGAVLHDEEMKKSARDTFLMSKGYEIPDLDKKALEVFGRIRQS